jgi:hypothetical protein
MRAKTKSNLKPREMFLVERIEKAEKQQAQAEYKGEDDGSYCGFKNPSRLIARLKRTSPAESQFSSRCGTYACRSHRSTSQTIWPRHKADMEPKLGRPQTRV